MSRKSFVRNVGIDVAQRAHNCRASKKHRIQRGDKRVGVKEGRSMKYYCLPCGIKSLEADLEHLTLVLREASPGT